MPTVLVKEFFRNFSGIFPEKFRASYFSGKVTTLTAAPSINSAVVGNWFWRRLVAHQRTSALSGFDWSLFDFIQPDVSSAHLDSLMENETTSAGSHEPYTCVSSA